MTVNIIRINRSTDSRVPALISILKESFGEALIRTPEQLKRIIDTESKHYFNAVEYNGKISGVVVYWELQTNVHFVEHIAVSTKCRGAKLGQKVLDHLFSNIKGLWLLEVENDNTHERLRNWYNHNGFEVVNKNYLQPPYNYGAQAVPLWIMSNQSLSSESVLTYISLLKYQVYEKHYLISRA